MKLKEVNWGSAYDAVQVEENELDYTDEKRRDGSLESYFNYFHFFLITQINPNTVID